MMDQFYNSCYPQAAVFWQQAFIDKRFKAGEQSLWSMFSNGNNDGFYNSRRFYLNLIRRHINMIAGYQRSNRKSTINIPLHDGDQLADDYNECLRWVQDRNGFQEYFSQAFEGGLDVGINLLHLYIDHTYDAISGDLGIERVDFPNFLMDPYFRKQDLSDCSGLWRRRWVSGRVAKNIVRGREKEIDGLKAQIGKDGRFPMQAELLNSDVNRLLSIDEFHYRDSREATMIIDPKSGEMVEWEDEGDEDADDQMRQILQQQPWLKVKKTYIPTVKLVIAVGGRIFYDGPNLLSIDRYPFVPLLCYHEPDLQSYCGRIQGVIRGLRDPQWLYNMRKTIEMDLLQSQVQNAWIYPIDVVVDPKAFRQTQNGCLIPLKKGHLPQEIQRLDPQGIPPSVLELSRSLAEDITKISGVNEELLGAATDDKSGILAMLRQGAGLITLRPVLDKADYSQRIFGEIERESIRKNFSKGKIRNILGREPDPRFFSIEAIKYQLAVEEGNYTTSQRQMELQQLLHFKEIGIEGLDEQILKASFITNKKEILQSMQQQQQQQQQMQQAQMQQQQQEQSSKIMAAYAKSKSDMASAAEKTARIQEIESKAEHSKTQADLDLVKMMIELEDLDIETLTKSFNLAQQIKLTNNQEMDTQKLKSQGSQSYGT
jgi:hypothetical protein